MALTAEGLSAAMRARGVADGIMVDGPQATAWCDSIAAAIVSYLVANAEVLPGTFTADGDPVTGVGELT